MCKLQSGFLYYYKSATKKVALFSKRSRILINQFMFCYWIHKRIFAEYVLLCVAYSLTTKATIEEMVAFPNGSSRHKCTRQNSVVSFVLCESRMRNSRKAQTRHAISRNILINAFDSPQEYFLVPQTRDSGCGRIKRALRLAECSRLSRLE